MSLQELRFLAYAASQLPHDIKPEPGKPYDMEIKVSEIVAAFGMSKDSAYGEIKALSTRLMQKIIQFDGADGAEVAVGLITKRRYFHGEGRVWFRFDEELIPHIMGLTERFTKYRIRDIYQFARPSTWRIYELLKQYKSIGKRDFELPDLYWKLGLTGKYARFVDMKKYVINPAVKEINTTSDILVDYSQRKRGRNIIGLTFIIRDNEATKTPLEKIRSSLDKATANNPCLAPDLTRMLRDEYKVGPKQAKQLADLASGVEEQIRALLPKLRDRWEALEYKHVSLGGYVFKALKSELIDRKQSKFFE